MCSQAMALRWELSQKCSSSGVRTCRALRVMKAESNSRAGCKPSTVSAMPTVCTGCAKAYNGLLAVRITQPPWPHLTKPVAPEPANRARGRRDLLQPHQRVWARRNDDGAHAGVGAGGLDVMVYGWEVAAVDRTDIKAGMVALSVRVRHGFNWLHCAAKDRQKALPHGNGGIAQCPPPSTSNTSAAHALQSRAAVQAVAPRHGLAQVIKTAALRARAPCATRTLHARWQAEAPSRAARAPAAGRASPPGTCNRAASKYPCPPRRQI